MGGDNFSPNIYSKGMYGQLSPGYTNMFNAFNASTAQPNYGIPTAPTMPSMSGVLSNVPMYNIPNAVGPTTDWWNSVDPNIKAGAWAPYEQGASALGEKLGSMGQLGSARGGVSGNAAAGFGDYYAQAANQYGLGLWNMSQPGLMADYNAQLQRGITGYGNQLTEQGMNYQNQMNQINQNYNNQMTAWQLPWQMATNYNSLMPSGTYHADSGGTMGSIMGSATSILAPFAYGYGSGMGSSASKP